MFAGAFEALSAAAVAAQQERAAKALANQMAREFASEQNMAGAIDLVRQPDGSYSLPAAIAAR